MGRNFFQAAALTAALVSGVVGAPANAAEEVMLQRQAPFDVCPQMVDGMLSHLGAPQAHVELMTDTGAHYTVKLISVDANLVFLCNAVSETITVTRTTPGELETALR